MSTPRMKKRENRRKYPEFYVKQFHLKLEDLIVAAQDLGLNNQYLFKTWIPDYPRPEFHVSRLKHDTNQDGLRGIRENGGFMNPHDDSSLVWFSLDVGPKEIKSAERRLLETTYPDRTDEQIQNQQSFLKKFASSPAFQRSSRYGSYRFTLSVEEVLKAYKDQFCSGDEPVMRVMETVLHKQEVVYVVLVHSPANQEQFSDYPLLSDKPNPICIYEDGCFKWRSEAMCGTHSYVLVQNKDRKEMEAVEVAGREEWYVWDHVAIALHVDDQVLKFDQLREKLTYCEAAVVTVAPKFSFLEFPVAKSVVKELWPQCMSPLMSDEERVEDNPTQLFE